MRRLLAPLALSLALAAQPIGAQDEAGDDGTFLENWLERNLSAAGRDVQVRGFTGALSSQATLGELTIADDDGIWFVLRDAELDWTRTALLTGRLEIDALVAREIEIVRRPAAISDGPQAEASSFALPELPVSIDIGRVTAERVVIGEALLGAGAVVRLDGRGQLEGGAGSAEIALERIDGREGELALSGSYANTTRQLTLDLSLHEGPDGIAATLIGLPGGDEIDLTIAGDGPIDTFDAAITLATAGQDRLNGTVTLREADEAGAPLPGLHFRADLAGDPRPLLQPDFHAFFGSDSRLNLEGRLLPNGLTEVSAFTVDTDGLALSGNAMLRSGGWPMRLHLDGKIAHPDGSTVRLPVGTPTQVRNVDLNIDYDARENDRWDASFTLEGLTQESIAVGSAVITGSGTLFAGGAGRSPRIEGKLDIAADGLTPTEPAVAKALGDAVGGSLRFSKSSGTPLQLSEIALGGDGYALTGVVALDPDVTRLDLIASGNLDLRVDDLARFADLAGQPLAGSARVDLGGNASLPDGPFNVAIRGAAQDLGIGQQYVDPLFAGPSTLAIDAVRDENGTRIELFDVISNQASAKGKATLKTGASTVEARVTVVSGASLAEGFDGPVVVDLNGTQADSVWNVDVEGTAPGGTRLSAIADIRSARQGIGTIEGRVSASIADLAPFAGFTGQTLRGGMALDATGSFSPDTADFALAGTAEGRNLALGNATIDPLIAGASNLAFTVRRENGIAVLENLEVDTREISARATGTTEGDAPSVTLTARMRDLARIVPGLPGAATISGKARLADGRWQVSGDGTGPGGTRLTASGSIAADGGDPRLSLRGRAPLEITNGAIAPRQLSGMADFDLSIAGGYGLPNVAGAVTMAGARLSLPYLQTALDPINGTLRLAGGSATIDLAATALTGGRITVAGPVRLSAPYDAKLEVRLIETGLADPALFDTTLNGVIDVTGPLTGGAQISGRLGFGSVEIRVPETGFGASGALPDLEHVAEPSDVRETRRRAGLLGQGGGGGGGVAFGLDLTIDAPSQVFVRGRGLDAEFGGSLRILGTTAAVIPQGGFRLIRGRLDLLGKRLTLSEGNITLQGSLDPYLSVVAETQADGTLVRIAINGLATSPNVTFSSSPDLPEDEILARLIFGRGLDQISPLQAVKLASAVATLAGKGGVGIVGRLRSNFGLDDLDVTTDSEGNLAVRAGTYITDNIYTDVTVSPQGGAEINLNLTITPNLTARGSVSSSGDTGLGVFFEKDY